MMLFFTVLCTVIVVFLSRCAGRGCWSKTTSKIGISSRGAVLFTCASLVFPVWASTSVADFDSANKLYDQVKYGEAVQVYEKLIESGVRAETVYFNLGNARFKSGQIGLAIAAWREAERLRRGTRAFDSICSLPGNRSAEAKDRLARLATHLARAHTERMGGARLGRVVAVVSPAGLRELWPALRKTLMVIRPLLASCCCCSQLAWARRRMLS
jgi:hypothetical protein